MTCLFLCLQVENYLFLSKLVIGKAVHSWINGVSGDELTRETC